MKKYFGMIAALLLPLVAFSASSGSLPYDKTTLGNSTNSNKSLIFNLGNGSSNPGFRGNDTSGKVEFTQDGSTWKAVGAGGGAGGGGVVLNENGGFEDGATAWTASGGTFTIETTLANVGFGLQSGAWDASANAETLSNTAVAVPAGLYGKTCSLSWYYKGGDSNLKAQVFDGTNVLAESSAFTAQATFSAKQAMYFPCPSSGNIQARFIASGNAAIAYFDDIKLGQETLVSGGSGLIASGYITGAGCGASKSGATLQSFATAAGCAGAVVENNPGPGVLLSTDYDLPKFTIQALPPGTYRVTFHSSFGTATASNKSIAITDGTTTAGRGSMYLATSFNDAVSVSAYFTYTGQADRTFELLGASVSGIINYDADATNNQRIWFSVDRMQGQGSTDNAITIDQSGWRIDANIGGAQTQLGNVTVSSYTGMSNAGLDMVLVSGSAPAQVPCSSTNPSTGLTCAAGDEQIGVVFNPPTAGIYEVCMAFASEVTGTGVDVSQVFQLVETANTSQTILNLGGQRSPSRISGANTTQIPVNVCGQFTFADTSQRTIRLFYVQNWSSGTASALQTDRSSGALGDRDLRVSVRRRVEYADAVKFTFPKNSVSVSAGNGQGSTNTFIRRFTNVLENYGTAITYADSATLGASFTINEEGIYTINYTDSKNASTPYIGITKNSTQGATAITSITDDVKILAISNCITSGPCLSSWTGFLSAGDVVRAHDGANSLDDGTRYVRFNITKVDRATN